MNRVWVFAIGVACGATVMALPRMAAHFHATKHGRDVAQGAPAGPRVHTEEKFSVTLQAPMERVAPLFGADKERVWAPEWDPQFVYPLPTEDIRGMVFTVAHGHRKAVWVNTQFDLKNGRVQYAYVIPDALATLITLQITAESDQTRVDVDYDRTALSAEADAHVRQLAERDRNAGTEWERQVNEYLKGENRN